MITRKTPEEIAHLREGGRRLAAVLVRLAKEIKPGMSALELDTLGHKLITAGTSTDGTPDQPAFLGYQPESAHSPYPASVCISINNEIVHGIPTAEKIFQPGDVVAIDAGLVHEGLITDAAVTVIVGKNPDAAQAKRDRALVKATREALEKGIAAVRPGGHVGDIGAAIEGFARPLGYGIVEQLAGHGVGYAVHEDPYVPNTGTAGEGDELVPGMVIAIEPMLAEGTSKVSFDRDGYTVRTKDGSRAAHFEHTVAVTEKGVEILTQ